ncbi:hypothetical protein K492DRAFT_190253 [Lichtheimia hyalospora FSU 10163]|nr:hypothetical protein K492DRAFT_190253 [Lichtheimia hyalospora FSU 10163]
MKGATGTMEEHRPSSYFSTRVSQSVNGSTGLTISGQWATLLSSLVYNKRVIYPRLELHFIAAGSWVEHLEGDTWQLQGVDLKQESHQQHKIQGMEIELVRAENAFEQHGKGSGRLLLGCTIIGSM